MQKKLDLKKNLPKINMSERLNGQEGSGRSFMRKGVTLPPFRHRIAKPYELKPPHPNNPTRFFPLKKVA